jgi:hypothetical protein
VLSWLHPFGSPPPLHTRHRLSQAHAMQTLQRPATAAVLPCEYGVVSTSLISLRDGLVPRSPLDCAIALPYPQPCLQLTLPPHLDRLTLRVAPARISVKVALANRQATSFAPLRKASLRSSAAGPVRAALSIPNPLANETVAATVRSLAFGAHTLQGLSLAAAFLLPTSLPEQLIGTIPATSALLATAFGALNIISAVAGLRLMNASSAGRLHSDTYQRITLSLAAVSGGFFYAITNSAAVPAAQLLGTGAGAGGTCMHRLGVHVRFGALLSSL